MRFQLSICIITYKGFVWFEVPRGDSHEWWLVDDYR